MNKDEQTYIAITYLFEICFSIIRTLMQNPQHLINSQINYYKEYQRLCLELSHKTQISEDKRFHHCDWHENIFFNFIKQSYLLLAKHIESLIKEIEPSDKKMAMKLRFYCHQLMDAIAPSNFLHINPEIIEKTFETKGMNLLNGLKQFIEDFKNETDQLNLQTSDNESFELGENIACTPGYVVYQNDLMQLIQYSATTDKIYQYPLLIVPPWINKYYILDLQKENSLVKWLVDQGFSVFMISWVNPTNQHKEKEFSDYMIEGSIKALEMIKVITGPRKINLLGYCIGGTLLGCMLAYLAKTNDGSISSATFLTTLLDFSEPGELGVFIDEYEINLLEKNMKINGYLDGRIMASVFNALKANDLIWSSFINKYLKGHKPKPFDFLFWNSDSTNIPEKVHSFYLRNMYLNNNLSLPDKLQIANTAIDLSKISIPCYFLATKDDHIVPWKTSYKSKHLLNGSVKFVLAGSGHVAGVVNPPNKNKYGYWTHPNPPKNPEKFLAKATYHEGSWWINWVKWIQKYSGKCTTFSCSNFNNQIKLENAPGSYVKQKN